MNIVALNETRKILDIIDFENFFKESSCQELGVEMLIEKSVLSAV